MHNSLIYNLNILLTFVTLIVSIVYCINIFLSHTFKKWEFLILSLSSSLVFIITAENRDKIIFELCAKIIKYRTKKVNFITKYCMFFLKR